MKIRRNPGLRNAILTKIVVDERGKSVEFNLVTDKAYSPSDEENAISVTKEYFPEASSVSVRITKLVADEELISKRIMLILKKKFPATASFIKNDDIAVTRTENGAAFCITIGVKEQGLFATGNILDCVAKELSEAFCGSFIGNVKAVEREEKEFVPDEYIPPEENELPVRAFKIVNYSVIDGGTKPEYAIYIADLKEGEDINICGRIVGFKERESSGGKPFFTFTLDDGTSNVKVTYFSKKKSVEEVRKLADGDAVAVRGDYTEFRGNLSFTAKYINRGCFPDDFVPEEKPTRDTPAAYKRVFPESFTDYNQSGFFDAAGGADWLKGKEFVVFDIETTGLNNTGVGGKLDAIIELGAVKIRDGEITEKFSSFVAADRKLSKEITALTGITDEMLVGAPPVSDVIADFYKFSDNCILVGHNSIGFDFKFINHYARENDFKFRNKMYDTLFMSQKYLRLPNYKLNTIADHYGVTFNHHRAFDDALATAKIFLAMIREGFLPD